ncbi:hypothetical protein POJ06DRAFT_249291 [Lipomyces tetrasporus]|uniref:Uncharacterized protein n=1 Tax=Lipomyces tetrasporus TaxID=54092 RepID=A0AAD7VTN8_9ASCO|nr:uncharacterized protein POJ06DRAFT_249291 [Lipomyces tetrasporus]KAJ8102292.1 hypothetical protein POJ06DRAFT_249291 [Lipomyces tetrasporus]
MTSSPSRPTNAHNSTDTAKGRKFPITISSSSALGLSNELTILREKFDREKAAVGKTKHTPLATSGTRASWKVQDANKGVEARNARDLVRHAEEQVKGSDKYATTVLEKKARQYEAIKKGRTKGLNLVDSVLDVDLMPQDVSEYDSEEPDDDELVEYTDEFGRSRMVSKYLVPKLLSDSDVKPQKPQNLIYGDVIQYNAFRGDEEAMRAILERDDTQDLMVHYDASKEIRTKGVGFYNFSNDETERNREMEALKNMREETKKMLAKSREVRNQWTERRQERRRQIARAKAEKDGEQWLESLGLGQPGEISR